MHNNDKDFIIIGGGPSTIKFFINMIREGQ